MVQGAIAILRAVLRQRIRGRLLALFVTMLAVLGTVDPAVAVQLRLVRRIRTTPFVGTSVWMKDAEGSAFVPKNKSLWLADDNGRSLYEVNHATGALKRVIGRRSFESARRPGGGPTAGAARTADFESIAYDRARDTLYVFSGPCCKTSVLPTVFRLKRNAQGRFRVESYRPLPRTANYTAAAWNPLNGKLYVGHGRNLRTYHYPRNRVGPVFRIPHLRCITGLGFSANGRDLFVTTSDEELRRVRWSTKRLVAGWTFDLTPFGIRDSRAVDRIGRRFFVLDGYDRRPKGDPRRFAVFVLGVV